jgi:hypothetical protein
MKRRREHWGAYAKPIEVVYRCLHRHSFFWLFNFPRLKYFDASFAGG